MAGAGPGELHLIMLIAFALGGGNGDLLDYLPTDAYWKAKSVTVSPETMLGQLGPGKAPDLTTLVQNLGSDSFAVREKAMEQIRAVGPLAAEQLRKAAESKDPEVAERARKLLEEVTAAGHALKVRQLMAMRTLGEMKHQAATAELEKLSKSADADVAFYARRSLALIEGRPAPSGAPADLADRMKADLGLLPSNVGLVGQYRLADFKLLGLEELSKVGGRGLGMDAATALERLAAALTETAEYAGPVRLDGLTVALSEKIARDDGFFLMVCRGRLDPKAFTRMIQAEASGIRKLPYDGAEVYGDGDDMAFFCPSSELLVFIVGTNLDKQSVIPDLIAAVKAGKGKLEANKDLMKLIDDVDKTGPVWAALQIHDTYREELGRMLPFLKGLSTMTGSSSFKDGRLHLAVTAEAADADAAKSALEGYQAMWAEIMEEGAREAARDGSFKALVEALKTVRAERDGKAIKLTATLTDPRPGPLVLPLFVNEALRDLGRRVRYIPPDVELPPDVEPMPPVPTPIPH